MWMDLKTRLNLLSKGWDSNSIIDYTPFPAFAQGGRCKNPGINPLPRGGGKQGGGLINIKLGLLTNCIKYVLPRNTGIQ